MSADAKVWVGDMADWNGIHDGPCNWGEHRDTSYGLTDLLESIEECMNCKMRWEPRTYQDGSMGLVGFRA